MHFTIVLSLIVSNKGINGLIMPSVPGKSVLRNLELKPKILIFDAKDTIEASWRYVKESSALSKENARAWRHAALAQSLVVTVGVSMAYGTMTTNSFHVAQSMIARGLGCIYILAFGISFRQNPTLIGSNGLAPCHHLLQRVSKARKDWLGRIITLPSLTWFVVARHKEMNTNTTSTDINCEALDKCLNMLAIGGFVLACPLALGVLAPKLAGVFLLVCYVFYLSISSVASVPFFGYGWESQLCETTILAGCWLLGDILGPGIIGMRWLCFKIMLGAGLIKKRASLRRSTDCWKDLSAMTTFFETQPMPGPFSRRLHFLSRQFHLFATASNHVIELVAPWLLFLFWLPMGIGRAAAISYGLTHILFQATLCISGNLSFLNYLTILPALACFDDGFFLDLFGLYSEAATNTISHNIGGSFFSMIGLFFFAWLNAPIFYNLFAPSSTRREERPRQKMNAAFDRLLQLPRLEPINLKSLRLANAYGAFGSVSDARDEIVILGSRGADDNYQFKEFSFHTTACRQIAPWHLRLDWQKWILACTRRDINGERWFVALLLKLIDQSPDTIRLLRHNPFTSDNPPTHIKVDLYRYQFRALSSCTDFNKNEDAFWVRNFRRTLLRPTCRDELELLLCRHDFSA